MDRMEPLIIGLPIVLNNDQPVSKKHYTVIRTSVTCKTRSFLFSVTSAPPPGHGLHQLLGAVAGAPPGQPE
jgi:hypothetical protein